MSYKLSPSKIHFISQCKLRFILSSKKPNKTVYSPVFNIYSFLGILIHSVLEEFIRKDLKIAKFDYVWSRQLQSCIKKYSFDTYFKLNLTYQLPYYIIKKEKFRLYLIVLLNNKNSNLAAEVPITGGYISGFVDLVEEDTLSQKVNIIDLKTGPIWELARGEIIGLKEGYRIQLLTYGTAYWEKGYLAQDITCTIRGLSEDEHISTTFTSEEYELHQKFLKKLKEEIEEASLTGNSDLLAFPTVTSCKYCEHGLSCSSLHKAVQKGTMLEAPFVIIDEINCEFDDSNSKINITTNGGVISIHRIPKELFIEIKDIVKLGTSIFVQGLYVLSHTRIKYWTRYSNFKSI
jgi:hypothetical protein